jgi:DNA (cytosine-5)-methyltransferase 1
MRNSDPFTQLPPVIDLFSGAGGLSQGFANAGFPVPYAIDNWDVACETHRLNHPRSETLCGDIREVSDEEIGRRFADARIVVGGPPCQGFSTAGKQLLDDPRNRLVEEFIRVVTILQPEAFLLENVEGLAKRSGGQLVVELQSRFEAMGYSVAQQVLAAVDFGLPQKRRRFMMLGLRAGRPVFPMPTHHFRRGGQQPLGLRPAPTFDDATSDLPAVAAGEENGTYAGPPKNEFQNSMREGATDLTLHKAPSHKPHMIALMRHIPQGASAFDVPDQIPNELMPKSGFPNSYARIRADQPGPTITRNFTTPSSANCIHPHYDRALTLREGARLQTFPDRYRFAGNFGDKRLQIGNAVPPHLAEAVARQVAIALGQQEAAKAS